MQRLPRLKIGARVSDSMLQKLFDLGMGKDFPDRIYISDEAIRKGVATIKHKLSGHYLPSDGHLEDIVRTILQNYKADEKEEIKDPYQIEVG